jgi:abortive infection alpha-like protein
MLKRVQERIPANRQTEPPAELVGPILNSMRYLDDSTELWSMFEEVLTKAVDNEQNMTIHPSFRTR